MNGKIINITAMHGYWMAGLMRESRISQMQSKLTSKILSKAVVNVLFNQHEILLPDLDEIITADLLVIAEADVRSDGISHNLKVNMIDHIYRTNSVQPTMVCKELYDVFLSKITVDSVSADVAESLNYIEIQLRYIYGWSEISNY